MGLETHAKKEDRNLDRYNVQPLRRPGWEHVGACGGSAEVGLLQLSLGL